MTYYVVDTHAFLWYLTASPQLSAKARTAFIEGDTGRAVIVVSAIVLLECLDILEKKKVALAFGEIITKLTQADNFIISEVNITLILETSRVKGFKDLHDRVIVATARMFDASLITRDAMIRKLYPRSIW